MKFDAVIIGSGLGGLECAYILAKNGMSVCVVEKNAKIGGCIQSFRRGDTEFDTGFHYVGALGKGEILEKIFNYFGLMELPWHQLDTNGFDQVVLQDKSYLLANGYDHFADSIAACCKASRAEIVQYSSFLKQVGEKITDPLLKGGEGFSAVNALFSQNAYQFLRDTVENRLVRDIVSGASLKLELCKDTLPLYTFAQINSSFVQSAWRLRATGSTIAEKLADNIRELGGVVMTSTSATELIEEQGKVTYIEVQQNGGNKQHPSDTERIYADYFISNLSPQLTLELIKDSSYIRPVFRHRIYKLEQTYGFFTVNIKLKKNTIPYLNRNIYYYSPDLTSVWDLTESVADGRIKGVLISQQVPKEGSIYAEAMDILTPMSFSEVMQWENTTVGHRGEAYKAFKARKAEQCISMAANCIPTLRASIENFYTSTPLTYMNYTGAVQGTAYGIKKDNNNLIKTLLTPRTPLSNLFFTGQNLNLHGLLGVSITSLLTCSQIIGKERMVSFLE